MTPARRVVIRKYGNRRLYDTSSSRYINLDDLAALVRNGRDIQVVDATTGEDLTGVTLTQIIVEDARQQPEGYPLELLRQVIVASNHAGREFLTWYVKSAFEAYQKVHGALQSRIADVGSFSPLDIVKGVIGSPAPSSKEIDELKQRIAELEARRNPAARKAPKKTAKPKRRRPAGKRSSRKPRR